MDEVLAGSGIVGGSMMTGSRRLKRRVAILAARFAMTSWLLLLGMPVAVVVYSLA
ncbi:hypothetical protein [Lichenicola sp.]|uniref:hypothetical protein n=1 Tax=Lichenicola sp. TaxID=2804529 RepID=UPI003B00E4CD